MHRSCVLLIIVLSSELWAQPKLFPRFACGRGWTSTLVVFNTGSKGGNIIVRLPSTIGITMNGSPIPEPTKQVSELYESVIQFEVPGSTTRRIVFDGPKEFPWVQVGYIVLDPMGLEVQAVLFYEARDDQGNVIESVPVFPQRKGFHPVFPVHITSNEDTAYQVSRDYTTYVPWQNPTPMQTTFWLFSYPGDLGNYRHLTGDEDGYISNLFGIDKSQLVNGKAFDGYVWVSGGEIVIAMFQTMNPDGTWQLSNLPALEE